MKTPLLALAVMLSCAMAYSQDKTTVDTGKKTADTGAGKIDKILPTIDLSPSQYEGKRAVYGGVLVNLARSDRPIRSLSPFGPSQPGSVTENLSTSPITGKPDGIRFFTISFKKW